MLSSIHSISLLSSIVYHAFSLSCLSYKIPCHFYISTCWYLSFMSLHVLGIVFSKTFSTIIFPGFQLSLNPILFQLSFFQLSYWTFIEFVTFISCLIFVKFQLSQILFSLSFISSIVPSFSTWIFIHYSSHISTLVQCYFFKPPFYPIPTYHHILYKQKNLIKLAKTLFCTSTTSKNG
jgi:hypothetical protein